MTEPHLVILGPTCSGKSDLAFRLALEQQAEIISCDSMQVYKGLEIGTAQPDRRYLETVPHYLIGEKEIADPYDVNIFLEAAKHRLAEIESRGKRAILVGGTGLYARALVYGHSLLPADKDVFQKIVEQDETPEGHQVLLARLQEANGGEAIPQDIVWNPRRFRRACEVLALTGKPPWKLHQPNFTPDSRFQQRILLPDFGVLKEKIRRRTAHMLAMGWVAEARKAFDNGLLETPTAKQALGYRDIYQFLEAGGSEVDPKLCELLSNRTIQYARRQMTWFKHQHPGAQFIE